MQHQLLMPARVKAQQSKPKRCSAADAEKATAEGGVRSLLAPAVWSTL